MADSSARRLATTRLLRDCAAQIPARNACKRLNLAREAASGGRRPPMGMLSAQFATCYKCEQQDKKGNLQRCLGWQLLKRLEDDATEFNRAQAQKAEQDAHGSSQGPAFSGATAGGSAAQPTSQQPSQPASLTAAMQDAAAAAPVEEEMRESKRFELFNRGASLQNYANCPFQVDTAVAAQQSHAEAATMRMYSA